MKAFIVTSPKAAASAQATKDIENMLLAKGYSVVNMETIDPNSVNADQLNRHILKALSVADVVVRCNGWFSDGFCRLVVSTARSFGVRDESENSFFHETKNTFVRGNWFDRKFGWWFTNAMKGGLND